jgi:HK97 gp10 family phage protein
MAGQRKGVTLKGQAELKRNLVALSKRLQANPTLEALYSAAEPVMERSEQLAPARAGRGRLKGSFVIEVSKKGEAAQVRMGPEKKTFYAYWVEVGTVTAAPHPYMRPALKEMEDEALQAAATTMGKELVLATGRR